MTRGHLFLKQFFGLDKSLERTTKGLGFLLDLRTSTSKQIIPYTLLVDEDFNVTTSSLYLYVTTIIPRPETQTMFNEVLRKFFTLKVESRTTDRKTVKTGKEFQLDNDSSTNINAHFI